MMRRKVVNGLAPRDAAASSASMSTSISTGWTARTTNGRVTNRSAMMTAIFVVGRVDAYGAVGPVEGEERDPGDDRRKRERQVDHAVERGLSGELVPDQDPRDHGPGEHVDHDHDQRRDHGPLERPPGLRVGDRVPERAPAAIGRLRDQGGDRDQHDDAEVRDDEAATSAPEARPGGRPRGQRWRCPLRRYSSARGNPQVLLVLGDAVVLVEELRRHLVPAAELVDGEQPGRGRELLRSVQDGLHDGPVAVVAQIC